MTKSQQEYITAYLAYVFHEKRVPRGIDGPDGRRDFDGAFDPNAARDRFYFNDEERMTIDVSKSGRYGTARVSDGTSLNLVFESDEHDLLEEVSGGPNYIGRIDVSGRTIVIDNNRYTAY